MKTPYIIRSAVWLASLALAAAGPVVVFAASDQPLSALPVDVNAVASTARPSIVTIFADRTLMTHASHDAPAKPRNHTRVGSGVAVSEDEILTTASVVEGAERVRVSSSNGLESEAQIVGVDAVFNLALLRVSNLRLPPIAFADGRPAQAGDWVISLGTSYGGQPTPSVGYVAFRYQEPNTALLQTTNTVYPGNSGGAALNALGQLVGIIQGELGPEEVAQVLAEERRPAGMSFIQPVEVARRVYESLHRDGRVPHGYLGASTSAASVPSETTPGQDVPIGARVESVVKGGPAALAGLKPGDLIVGFQTDRVEYPAQLARWVATTPPATAIHLVWVRDELQQSGTVKLTASPDAAPRWSKTAAPLASADGSQSRIADLQRQIEKLSRELDQLKAQRAPDRR